MSADNSVEFDVSKYNAQLYLKGVIVGYSVANGMKWESKRKASPVFQMGYDDGKSLPSWNEVDLRARVTAIHIEHNRLRHGKPHTASFESDEMCLSKVSSRFMDSIREKMANVALEVEKKSEVKG